jgi:hypothetical protein
VLEGRHRLSFLLEASLEAWVLGDVFVHDFDDDVAIEIRLPGEVDFTHPAFAQGADDTVTVEKDFSLQEILRACQSQAASRRWSKGSLRGATAT